MFLEIVPFEVEDTIRKVSTAPDFKDNIERIRYLNKYMQRFGFIPVGSGTNRTVFKHPKTARMADGYDVVFKIALDSRGIKDNGLEHDIYFEAPEEIIEKGYLIEVFEKTDNDLILVSREADIVMDMHIRVTFNTKVCEMFTVMDQYYLLDDMDPANLAIIKHEKYDGTIEDRVTIIDSANIVRKEKLHLYCTSDECVGEESADTYLIYTRDMKQMFCPRCGTHYTFADIKGTAQLSEDDIYKNFIGNRNTSIKESRDNAILDTIESILYRNDDDEVPTHEAHIDDYNQLINNVLDEEYEYEEAITRKEEYENRRRDIIENNFCVDTALTPSQLETIIRESEYDDYGYGGDEDDEVYDVNNYFEY